MVNTEGFNTLECYNSHFDINFKVCCGNRKQSNMPRRQGIKHSIDEVEGQKEGQVWTGPALGGSQMKYHVFPDPFTPDAFILP
jgi:hypothetical protein